MTHILKRRTAVISIYNIHVEIQNNNSMNLQNQQIISPFKQVRTQRDMNMGVNSHCYEVELGGTERVKRAIVSWFLGGLPPKRNQFLDRYPEITLNNVFLSKVEAVQITPSPFLCQPSTFPGHPSPQFASMDRTVYPLHQRSPTFSSVGPRAVHSVDPLP